MNGLIVDTTENRLKLIVLKQNEAFFYAGTGQRRHTGVILPAMDKLLGQAGLSLCDLNAIGVVNGPGSYTGIRIGASIGNSFAFCLKIPLIEITALEYRVFNMDNCLSLIDSGHDYYTLKKEGSVAEYTILSYKDALKSDLTKIFALDNDDEKLIPCFLHKYQNNDFVDLITPFYLKKSSAEV